MYTLHSESNLTMLVQLLLNFLFPSQFVFSKNFKSQNTDVFLDILRNRCRRQKGILEEVSTSSDENNSSTTYTIVQYDFLRISDKVHRYFSDDTSNLFRSHVDYGSLCDHSYCARYGQHERKKCGRNFFWRFRQIYDST